MGVQSYFTEEDRLKIKNAIRVAETNTSGEIRLHVEKYCKDDMLDQAAYVFEKLEMHKTKLRNGVLFYLAVEDRKFAVLGDVGINQKVPEDFWKEISNNVIKRLKNGEIADGISEGIVKAGEQLKEHFPYQSDDINELSDEISFGKNN